MATASGLTEVRRLHEACAQAAVRTQGLTKRYANDDGVRGLDLVVPRGCKFGLLGPNGAGKSTTLKMLMGTLRPDSGELEVLGQTNPADHALLRARIGYVPERHYIYRWMTVGEVIRFTRAFYPTWNTPLCEVLLAQYGLTLGKKVEQLSHGMLTKLALTLALSHEPELLILDEPTTGLDPLIREEFIEGVLHPLISETERTVIFSSHIMSDIESVSDTIAILHEGRLLTCRSREALVERTKRVIVSTDTELDSVEGTVLVQREDRRWLLTIADFDSGTMERIRALPGVRNVEVRDMTLEEVFKDHIRGARAAK